MNGESVVSPVIASRGTGNAVVVVAAPIKNAGRSIGVLFGALDMRLFGKRFVLPLVIGKSGYTFVADRTGTICSHPDRRVVLSGKLSDFPFGDEIGRKKDGTLRYGYEGQEIGAVYRTDPKHGWVTIARVPIAEIMESTRQIQRTNVQTGVVTILVATLLLFLVSRSIVRPIAQVVKVAELVALGKLACARTAIAALYDVRSEGDETAALLEAVARMTDGLSGLVGEMHRSSENIVASTSQIAGASHEQQAVARGFEGSTTEVFTAVKQITATSQELSGAVRHVRDVADHTAGLAVAGRSGLDGMDASIDQLVEAAGTVATRLAEINEKALRIESVVTTMTKVAARTNLLSLNATIEARKAGASGRGFAVVAQEIRRLSDQTAASTLDIERMVKEMRGSVESGVGQVRLFSEEVAQSARTIREVGQQLAQIILRIQEVAPKLDAVNETVGAQAQGALQISQAMRQVSDGAARTVESIHRFDAAAEQLRESARQLQQQVAEFQL
jgi:methyl-accepting chemotaxis protein WspA